MGQAIGRKGDGVRGKEEGGGRKEWRERKEKKHLNSRTLEPASS